MMILKSGERLLLSVCAFVLLVFQSRCYAMRSHIAGRTIQTVCKRQVARFASVSGIVYSSENSGVPSVCLFTKEGCTLCDKVKNVLLELRESHPHGLEQVDITDEGNKEFFDRYKYDIPVLHVNGLYWTKHRLSKDEAVQALVAAANGSFVSPPGEPDASRLERNKS
jgi:hypothetical protein